MGPTPFAGMVLADMGAEVIRIDRPDSLGRDEAWELRGRNKRSVALNLKDKEGLAAFFDLVASADALIEGYRPGVTERLGLGPQDCAAVNPKLVYARATGWGQDGPLAQQAGHDINYIALTGALHMIGQADGPPVPPLNLVGDYGGGAMFLVTGILAAMLEASRSGRGQVVDAAMVDGTNMLLAVYYGFMAAGQLSEKRGSNRLDGGLPWYDSYLTQDGHYMAVGALEDKFYAALLQGLGLSDSAPDRRDAQNWPALRAAFATAFLGKTRAQWAAIFDPTDACVTPVWTLREAQSAPHNLARQAAIDVAGIPHPRPAPRFPAHPAPTLTPPVSSGADTAALLRQMGWSPERIATALSRGAVAQAE